MEAIAKAKFARFGSRKVNSVLGEIRGKSVQTAAQLLPLIPRIASQLVAKTLNSAAANLQSKAGRKIDASGMWVKEAYAGNGPMKHMKRVLPAPMGRAFQFKRKVCHLTIVVADEPLKRN
ncbi:MAG: 50S ribosomal protein L22 [Elusimicrobia bacterium]|nr:50S ribosomal protein L22 [Elusimicrobiota bacterium]